MIKIKLLPYLLLTILLISVSGNSQTVDKKLIVEVADIELASGKYKEALYHYFEVYKLDENFKGENKIVLPYYLALCLNKLNSYAVSNSWLDKAVSHPKANSNTEKQSEILRIDNTAKMALDNKIDYLSEQSITARQNALKSKSFITNGEYYYSAKDFTKAKEQFEIAFNLLTIYDFDHWQFLYHYADCCLKGSYTVEDGKKGVRLMLQSLELNPKSEIMVPFTLALVYDLDMKDYKSAMKWYKYTKDNFTLNEKTLKLINEYQQKCGRTLEQIDIGLKQKPINVKITNLGTGINTKYGDYFPSITADESMLLFTSTRNGSTGGLLSSGKNDEDLWYATSINDSVWSESKNFGSPVNTPNNNGIASFTGDGQFVVCGRCGEKDGYGSCDIYYSTLNGKTWSEPKNIGPVINSALWDAHACISSDGKILIWASMRAGGKGQEDLWISYKDTLGTWSSPKNLGDNINTAGSELCPYLLPDGKTLYFSSDNIGPRIGGYDIFKTTLGDNGSWSKPENIGYPINSEYNDLYFVLTPSGIRGYFASDRPGGSGEMDIYKIILPQQERSSLTTLVGYVFDEETKVPIETGITVEDIETGKVIGSYVSNSATGKFVIVLTPGRNYSISANKKQYLFYSANFNLPKETEFKEVKKEIFLQKIKAGNKIVLNNIFFDSGQSTLKFESNVEIDRLYKLMLDNPQMKVEISGHTDNTGNPASNQLLSKERAAIVTSALIKKGIEIGRLISKGYGHTQSVATNDTEEGKQLNRRTEFKVL